MFSTHFALNTTLIKRNMKEKLKKNELTH